MESPFSICWKAYTGSIRVSFLIYLLGVSLYGNPYTNEEQPHLLENPIDPTDVVLGRITSPD